MNTVDVKCQEYRKRLRKQVLDYIAKAASSNESSTAELLAENAVIVVDFAPFQDAHEAVASENAIDWFDPEQADRQRACRGAFAALELQDYLRRITGNKKGFEIADDAVSGRECLIIHVEPDAEQTDGSFEIRREDENYIFTGPSIQGPLYAVYEYLEQIGCGFYRPGRSDEYVPKLDRIPCPRETRQKPSFRVRRLHDYRKNRATPELIDWMAKARINLWGSDNLIPGMRMRGILLSSGMHDVLPVAGLDHDYCISDPRQKSRLTDSLIEAFAGGPWKDADVCDYIGADWGRRCSCDKCRQIGTPSDIEVHVLYEIRKALRQAYLDGKLNRDLPVMGYAYFDCERPPSRPVPADFDSANISIELWVMRCWEHFIGEPACGEDFPIVSTMNDFFGQRFNLPGNMKIHSILTDWTRRQTGYTGEIGFGYYLSNAGNYWLPLCQMSILSYELPYIEKLGVQRTGYMHISPSDWGPKAAVNTLFGKLSWNTTCDPAKLLADYFVNSYGGQASDMAEVYFDLERAMANVFTLKRYFVNGVKNFGFTEVSKHSHIAVGTDHDKAVINVKKMSEYAFRALDRCRSLAGFGNSAAAGDVPWLEYAAWTVELYRILVDVVEKKEKGYFEAAGKIIQKADEAISKLRSLDLEISLPEKIHVDCAQATGILDLVQSLAEELGTDLHFVREDVRVQTSIEPVSSRYQSDGKVNPTRWYPDPEWTVVADGDEIGLDEKVLIETGIKHMGLVAQRVGGEMLFASVGDDWNSETIMAGKWEVKAGASVVCFDGSGQLRWRHDFARIGYQVNTGPWPAFIDISGKGDWAVSVFVMYDGGQGRREGLVRLYEAKSGKLLWETDAGEYDYPGGNGSCVVDDIDRDGRREIVYGLCNCVKCVDARTGKSKWIFDEGIIQICHGRLALADVNDDGIMEIVVATEYGDERGNPENDRSSILTLDGRGKLIRRMRNIQGDLGSTQIVVEDVDRDGLPEIIHGSENLCFHEPRHMAELMVRERYLVDKLDAVQVGGVRFAVGDIDGDGYPEAVGITSYRDGGPYVRPEIYCVRVFDGKLKWRRPVSRVWFDGDAVMADIDGDGRLEAIVSAQYSSGYMQEPGTESWGDLYIVKSDGRIMYKKTFADSVLAPIVVDADNDGTAEIVIPCYDGKIYVLKTKGKAADADWPVVCQNMQRTGVYPNHI